MSVYMKVLIAGFELSTLNGICVDKRQLYIMLDFCRFSILYSDFNMNTSKYGIECSLSI